MPGIPSVELMRPADKNNVVSKEDREQYRTGAGMLLYLVKLTRPDISNYVMGLTILNDVLIGNTMK